MKAIGKSLALAALLAALLAAWLWHGRRACARCAELDGTVRREAAAVRACLGDRFERLERRLDGLASHVDEKLDGIEAKIDRILELATPRLPDGMRPTP